MEEQKKAKLSAKMEDMGLMPTNQTSPETPEAAPTQEKPAKGSFLKGVLFWLGSLAIIGAVIFFWLQEPKRGEQQNAPQPASTAVEVEKPEQPAPNSVISEPTLPREEASPPGIEPHSEKDEPPKTDTRESAVAPSPTPSDTDATAPREPESVEKTADADTDTETETDKNSAAQEPQPITRKPPAPRTESGSSTEQPDTKSPTAPIAKPEPAEKIAGEKSPTTVEEERTGHAASAAAGTPYGGYPQRPHYPYYPPAPGYGYPPAPYPYPAQPEAGR